MRCPDCNKFVAYDAEVEPELDVEVDDEGVVRGTVRIVNTCQECGTELKEATLDVEIDMSSDFVQHTEEVNAERVAAGLDPIEHRAELLDSEAVRSERTQTTDRHGKAIRSSRYMKHFYGADVTARITCACHASHNGPQWETDGTDSPDVQASGMDELA